MVPKTRVHGVGDLFTWRNSLANGTVPNTNPFKQLIPKAAFIALKMYERIA